MLDFACLVLAAGNSRRFGSDKMMHPFESGKSMIEATVEPYLSVFDQLTVVVKADAIADHPLAGRDEISLIVADRPDSGMSQSLIAGVQANRHSDGWLIGLGDMPYLAVATIRALVTALDRQNIVQPMVNNQPGNPVGFGAQFLPDLLQLTGDRGGKSILRSHPDSVEPVVVQDAGILEDVDRPVQIR